MQSRGSDLSPPISFVDAVKFLLRNHRALMLAAVLGAALGISVTLVRPRSFTAAARFMPQTRTQNAASGLAAQLGMTLPGSDASQSPDFYVELIRSREILSRVANAPLVTSSAGTTSTSIADKYGGSGTKAKRQAEAVRWLSRRVATSSSGKTGLVSLAVRMPSAPLALTATEEILDQIATFDRDRRNSQASKERQFIEEQLTQARESLRTAENVLQTFLQENRTFGSSPRLTFEQDRLAREVSSRQVMVNTLTTSFQQARVEEVRNTPVLTVIEHPELPVSPDSRHLVTMTFLGAMLGFTFMLLAKLIGQYFDRKKEESPSDSHELSVLSSQFFSDIRHPLRLIGIRKSRAPAR
jgi:uncharacterized protein involved in exopolysaccharide biosynthesis